MCHAQDLTALCDCPELIRDLLRGAAADARIDLVEDHGSDRILCREHIFHCKHNARQFAAGGNLGEWPQCFADIGRHQEADGIQTVFLRGLLRKLTDKLDLRHIQLYQFGRDRRLEGFCRRFPCRRKCHSFFLHSLLQR